MSSSDRELVGKLREARPDVAERLVTACGGDERATAGVVRMLLDRQAI